MLQLYVVLGLMILESVLVFLFLLPRKGFKFVHNLLSRFLGSNTMRKILIALFIILSFLVVEAFQEMRYRESEEHRPPHPHADVGQALQLKSAMFRAQRNFYLTFFTLALYVMMFRLRGIHAEVDELESAMVAKKKD